MEANTTSQSRVVIIGGGYAGVRVARDLGRLARRYPGRLEVVLLSDTPYHEDVSIYYEVATAYLDHESSSSSEQISAGVHMRLQDMLASQRVQVRTGRVRQVRPQERLVELGDRQTISYDWLVLAVGSRVATYGIPGVVEHAFSIKTLADALRVRHHIVRQFHHSAAIPQKDLRQSLTFVVVGGGSAGVETAAELMGQVRRECRKHALDPTLASVWLVEGGSRVLGSMPEHISAVVQERLRRRGVTLQLNTRIVRVRPDAVELSNGTVLPTRTVVWAAGLAPHELLQVSGLPLKGWGVAVNQYLQVIGWPTIFAAGDIAVDANLSPPRPATIPVAYSQGRQVATNIRRAWQRQPLLPYRYVSLGALITVGGQFGVLELARGRFMVGWIPWLIKQLIAWRYWNWYLTQPQVWRLSLARWRMALRND